MTNDERARLKALCERANAGPWTVQEMPVGWVRVNGPLYCIADEVESRDGRFIAAARTALPALLEENERLRALLRKMEYVPFGDGTPGPALSWPSKEEVDRALLGEG